MAMDETPLEQAEMRLREATRSRSHVSIGTLLNLYDESGEEQQRALVVALATRVVTAMLRSESSACGARRSSAAAESS